MRGLVLMIVTAVLALAACTGGPTRQADGARTHSEACSSSVNIDNFSDELNKATFADTSVDGLSGLAEDTDGGVDVLSDRSMLFTLDPRTMRPTGVVPLADESGRPLDSEGLVVDRDGTRLITSEIEPSVRRYTRTGELLGSLAVPQNLRVAPVGRASTNLTFEGLAAQPDGRTLVASMEAALAGDQPGLVRFQTWTRASGAESFQPTAQYGYPVDSGLGVSEITPTGDGQLLVLERGYTPETGNTVRLFLANPQQASDISTVNNLTRQPGINLISKRLLTDLVDCPAMGATAKQYQRNPLLDNIEGMTVIGRNSDNGLRLLLVSDDNKNPNQVTRLYQLTVHLPVP